MKAGVIADGITAAVSHLVTIQVVNQGRGIWGSLTTGLITAGAAIAAVMLTHRFNLQRERYFIATELVFLLERFAQ